MPTCQDLAGFWDMVHIQVEQIHKRFDDLVELKKRNWVAKVGCNLMIIAAGVFEIDEEG